MIDREYLKLNTSVQTGSNSATLLTDDEGNIEASVELRFPSNMDGNIEPGKKIDKIEMATTKFRISMMETPIAAIPLDSSLNNSNDFYVSPCKLDVYPFSVVTNEGTLEPFDYFQNIEHVFQYYKKHHLCLNFYINANNEREQFYTSIGNSNTFGNILPRNSPFYPIFSKYNLFDKLCNHALNLAISKKQSFIKTENGQLYIKNIGTLESIIADAIGNAMTYASCEIDTTIDIDLLPAENSESADPKPLYEDKIKIGDVDYVLWKYTISTNVTSIDGVGIHPKVTIDESSLSLSYDSASFFNSIPVLWNASLIQNFEMPAQIHLDEIMSAITYQPPPKRFFKYGCNVQRTAYNFMLNTSCVAGVFNLIANKMMKDTLSFLPWIKLPTRSYEQMKQKYIETYQTVSTPAYKTFLTYHNNSVGNPHNNCRIYVIQSKLSKNTQDVPSLYSDLLQYFPENGSYELYYYELDDSSVIDIPENRKNQLFCPGIISNSSFDINELDFRTITYTTDPIVPEVIQTDETTTTITSETTTTTPSYPIGTTIISETREDNGTSTESTETPEFIYCYGNYHPANTTGEIPQPATITISNQNYQYWFNIGEWNEENELNLIPTGAPSFVATVPSTSPTDVKICKLLLYDQHTYTSTANLDHPGKVLAKINTDARITWYNKHVNSQLNKNEVVVTFEETEIEDDTKLEIIPNIYQGEELYLLDASGVNVTMHETEPIQTPTQYTVTKTVTDTYTKVGKRVPIASTNGDQTSAKYWTFDKTVGVQMQDILTPLAVLTGFHYRSGLPPNRATRFLARYVISDSYHHWSEDSLGCYRPEDVIYDWWFFLNLDTPKTEELRTYPANIIGSPTIDYKPTETHTQRSDYVTYDPSLVQGTSTTPTRVIDKYTDPPFISGPVPIVGQCSLGLGEVKFYVWNKTTGVMTEHTSGFEPNSHYNPRIPMGELSFRASFMQEDVQGRVTMLNSKPSRWFYHGDEYEDYFVISKMEQLLSGKYAILQLLPLENPDPGRQDTQTISYSNTPLTTYAFDASPVFYETITTTVNQVTTTDIGETPGTILGNVRITYTWNDLPMVVMSPIQSIVLIATGLQISQEVQPINKTSTEGSSLTSTIPLIENYYSLAQTLRDLHDELVVAKDSFDDLATYNVDPLGIKERTLKLTANYITKDGNLHKLFIPPNGVFSLQVTFALDIVSV